VGKWTRCFSAFSLSNVLIPPSLLLLVLSAPWKIQSTSTDRRTSIGVFTVRFVMMSIAKKGSPTYRPNGHDHDTTQQMMASRSWTETSVEAEDPVVHSPTMLIWKGSGCRWMYRQETWGRVNEASRSSVGPLKISIQRASFTEWYHFIVKDAAPSHYQIV
jgi:hypothetical protein